MLEIDNKFKVGAVVFAKVNPKEKMVVRRFVHRIYYCRFPNEPNRKEAVYFERELLGDVLS